MFLDTTQEKYKLLIGKRVTFESCSGEKFTGRLDYAGVNPLHNTFQVTVNRMPIWPVKSNTLREFKNEHK
jgi:hypothetical protein